MDFRAGQKVRYVGSGYWCREDGSLQSVNEPGPVPGSDYTITEVEADNPLWAPLVFLVLQEFGNAHIWDARLFRPLDERKTDISMFQQLLTPQPTREVV